MEDSEKKKYSELPIEEKVYYWIRNGASISDACLALQIDYEDLDEEAIKIAEAHARMGVMKALHGAAKNKSNVAAAGMWIEQKNKTRNSPKRWVPDKGKR